MDGWMDVWIEGWIEGWTVDGWIDGRTRVHGRKHGYAHGPTGPHMRTRTHAHRLRTIAPRNQDGMSLPNPEYPPRGHAKLLAFLLRLLKSQIPFLSWRECQDWARSAGPESQKYGHRTQTNGRRPHRRQMQIATGSSGP